MFGNTHNLLSYKLDNIVEVTTNYRRLNNKLDWINQITYLLPVDNISGLRLPTFVAPNKSSHGATL